jgi:hypothetical protein
MGQRQIQGEPGFRRRPHLSARECEPVLPWKKIIDQHMKTSILRLTLAAIGVAVALSASSADVPIPKAGLQLWLSADHVELVDGAVTVIKDLSGKNNNARRDPPTATPASNPAVAKDSISGQPVLRFTGDNIAFGFNQITNIYTAFWVVSKDAAAFGKRNEKFVLGDQTSNDFHAGWTDDVILNTDVNPGHLSKFLANAKTWLDGRPVIASKTPFARQLSLICIVSTGPVKAGQLARDRSFSGRAWQGDIAEILLYSDELSETDRQAVEKYLMVKYHLKPGSTADAAKSN